ncbi:MAG: hypothetical protein JKY98_10760 [Gammaproteobacteria bacterium]|nr:hypothetical protein [Gammaproteobacteria bacterium]
MLLSLLKIRKKTSSVITGILIGAACLWGVSMWQDITPRQLFNLFLGSFLLILGIMLMAGLLIFVIKMLAKLIRPKSSQDTAGDDKL